MAAEGSVSDDESLPPTLTPKDVRDLSISQDRSHVSANLPWGRLITCKRFLKNVDLTDKFRFGRGGSCHWQVSKNDCPNILHLISKVHFEIHKSDEDQLVYIKDLSKNGTYVNGVKLGLNSKKILKSKDEIGIAQPPQVIYIYMSLHQEEADNFLPRELTNRFASICPLGRGSCGEVRLVKDRDTFHKYAVKKILLTDSLSALADKINHPTKVRNEIEILSRLQHPCVITLHDFIDINRSVYLILEYMEGGELTHRILEAPMREDVVKFYFYQMLSATQYLHSQNIVHRDLKPENILLRDQREETLLKISDFGLSKITEHSVATTMCGTMRYVAPEVINKKLRNSGEYGTMVDVWSLGVILYLMISQELPFKGLDNPTIAKNILTGNFDLSNGVWSQPEKGFVKNLLRKLLQCRPENRISLANIFKHTWIQHDHCVKFRVRRLLEQEGLEIKDIEEPSPKKFKFNLEISSSSSSDGSNTTFANSSGEFSTNTTICCQ